MLNWIERDAMKRKDLLYRSKKRHISNRHLADKYYYAGEHETVTNVRLTQYNGKVLHSHDVKELKSSFRKLVDPECVNWFQVSGLTDAETVTRIAEDFGLHTLDAKDILTPQHVVKIEDYKNRVLIVLNACYYDTNAEIHTEHICLLIAGNVIVTFTESNNPVFETVYKALGADLLGLRRQSSGLLLAFLLNTIIANLVETVSKNEEMLTDIEDTLLNINSDQSNIGSLIQQRRREYMLIRKSCQPLKEQFAKLLRAESGVISPDIMPIYTDLSDQLLYVVQTADNCREIISSLVDLYISNNDFRLNTIMKRLTIVSTLFIPLTFLVGVWGMNFKGMPELEWRYGYAMAWMILIATLTLTWFYMKRKDWY